MSKLFGKADDEESGPDAPINLDLDARRGQLHRLEKACDALTSEMRSDPSMFDRPGWKERLNEYNRVAGTAQTMRQGQPTREGLIDLAFEVRPVFGEGRIPAGMEQLGPLQDEVVAAARDLQDVLPGERP